MAAAEATEAGGGQDLPSVLIAGVPEHFNRPITQAIKRGEFVKAGVNVRFKSQPGGTGAMVKAVVNEEADVVIALTEGLVAALVKEHGDSLVLVGNYVVSPLVWAITAAGSCEQETIDQMSVSRVAVSRMGSGSHLMAFLLAEREKWAKTPEFVVLRDYARMRAGLNQGTADILLWEQAMQAPFVSSGELSRVGELESPWPCFMMCARK